MLRALGWDHPRCMSPMRACAERWREMTGVEIDWEARSLEAFGDQPLEEAAAGYDLIVIDHPFCGRAAATRCLTPLDELLDRSALDELRGRRRRPQPRLVRLRRPPVGPGDRRRVPGHRRSATSCSTASRRRRHGTPCSSSPAAGRARSRCRSPLPTPSPAGSASPRRTARSRSPTRPSRRPPRRRWRELARLGPAEALGWEPPDILGRLTTTDEIACVPLTYGYSTYSSCGRAALPVRRRAGRRRRPPRRRARRGRPGGLRGVVASPDRPPSSPPGRAAARRSARSSPAPAGSPATARHGTIRSSTGSPAGSTRAPARRSMARGCGRARSGGRCSSSTPGAC